MSVDYARKLITLFEGDPRVFMGENGSFLSWVGGQPVMDSGLENAVFISLFTTLEPRRSRLGWAGNYLYPNTDYHIGSRYIESTRQPITLSALNDIRQAGLDALAWMRTKQLVSDIQIDVTNPQGDQLRTEILIRPPDLPIQKLLLIKNGINWIYQIEDPANLREAGHG